ncbi:methionine--tRNA ligase [Candidatus Dojkabacteria bacterium]|nr:methionine--tRNA ligase [Candidatus Dojkabacteria bacterium]
MRNNSEKIFIAVAWPYVNGNLHVGHLAGYLLPADVFARYQRLRGRDVLMVSGSDCHGTPITVQADKEGKKPVEIVNEYHKRVVELFDLYDLTYNLYTKTTTENHKRVVHELFLELLKSGFIVKGVMKQYYSAKDNKFLPDRYVEGICPHCKAKEQRSDQCENCGRWLKDGELIDPVSKLSGESVELKDTEHYFLDFPKLENDLKRYLNGEFDENNEKKSKKEIWREWVFAEAFGWLSEGMEKRAITRDLDWSIVLPEKEIKELAKKGEILEDQVLANFEGKRIYVWFEAVTGYLSAPQEWNGLVQSDPAANDNKTVYKKTKERLFRYFKSQSKNWKDWWMNPNSKHYYFMGQDNLVFHTLMWPGQLIGANKGRKANEKYALPYNVVVNKFLNFNKAKFSKSRENIIDSREIAEEFGTDAVRYFILSNLPENKESNFIWERFVDVVNDELVANLGNFINRTLVFYDQKMMGKLESGEIEEVVKENIHSMIEKTGKYLEKVEFANAIYHGLMELARFANRYFNDKEIWSLIKTDKKAAENVMYNLLQLVEALRLIIRPFLPMAATKLSKILGREEMEHSASKDDWGFTEVKETKLTGKVELLFEKIDKELVLKDKTGK